MSGIPSAWVKVCFDDAIDVVSDRGHRIKQKEYLLTGLLPVVDQGEGLVGGYTNDLSAKVESNGSVIVFGDHTRRFKFVNFPFAVGADGVKLFRPAALWSSKFLYWQLGTINLEDRGYGRHYQHLRKESLVLPPIAEQVRIVEKLEELLSDLDAGVSELKAAQKKLAQYRQSLLKAAVEGALTAQWRVNNSPTETGAQLLERILQERRARWEAKQLAKFKEQGKAPPKDWQKKYPEPVQPDTTDLPEFPHGWGWGSFEQLFDALSDSGKKLPQAAYAQAGLLPVIDQGAQFIGGYTDDVSLLFDGALPVIGFGDHTRRFKLIQNPFVVGADGLKLISISSAWIPDFAFIACSTLDFEDRGYSRHFQFIRNASFSLPPLAEQNEIVVSVAARLKENDDISEAIELALKQSAAQRQNILKAAFSGQLVPQDPSDEPASELLARIRAERAVQQAVKKPRGRKVKEAA